MTRMRRLGEILVASGLVTEQELDRALEEQSRTKKRLGEILVEKKIISHSILTVFLAQQLGIEYVVNDASLTNNICPFTTPLTQLEAARYQAILVDKEDDCLIIGIVDPYDYEMLRELLHTLNCKVKFTLLTPFIFTKLYNETYFREERVSAQAG